MFIKFLYWQEIRPTLEGAKKGYGDRKEDAAKEKGVTDSAT
jgi:hypothetical protein